MDTEVRHTKMGMWKTLGRHAQNYGDYCVIVCLHLFYHNLSFIVLIVCTPSSRENHLELGFGVRWGIDNTIRHGGSAGCGGNQPSSGFRAFM